MSRDAQRMLRAATAVLQAQMKHANVDQARGRAYRIGLRFWRSLYGRPLIVQAVRDLRIIGRRGAAVRRLLWVMRHSPSTFLPLFGGVLRRPLRQVLRSPPKGYVCW
jgi:hypothetical protein